VLTASGYRVLASSDETEAVELYRRDWREIGAVLADLTMAEMGEVLGALRQINPAVRVVGSSTMSPGMIPARLGVPEEYFLRKPYQTSALLDALRRVLGHEEGVAAAVERAEERGEMLVR